MTILCNFSSANFKEGFHSEPVACPTQAGKNRFFVRRPVAELDEACGGLIMTFSQTTII